MRVLVPVLLLPVLGSCFFDPELRDGVVACGPDPDPCPPGMECRSGLCFHPRSEPVEPQPDGGVDGSRRTDSRLPHCRDGRDNDCDGLLDLEDPGCASPDDESEHSEHLCDDGVDNDGDKATDYRPDPPPPGCADGDPQCESPIEDSEQ